MTRQIPLKTMKKMGSENTFTVIVDTGTEESRLLSDASGERREASDKAENTEGG